MPPRQPVTGGAAASGHTVCVWKAVSGSPWWGGGLDLRRGYEAPLLVTVRAPGLTVCRWGGRVQVPSLPVVYHLLPPVCNRRLDVAKSVPYTQLHRGKHASEQIRVLRGVAGRLAGGSPQRVRPTAVCVVGPEVHDVLVRRVCESLVPPPPPPFTANCNAQLLGLLRARTTHASAHGRCPLQPAAVVVRCSTPRHGRWADVVCGGAQVRDMG